MIVLQRIFDICAEELAVYLGMDFEGFIVVTVSKLVHIVHLWCIFTNLLRLVP